MKRIIFIGGFFVLLYVLVMGADKIRDVKQRESLSQVENSLRKAVLTCYAREGRYPPTIQYLKENYGIQMDETKYDVFYEVQGSNLMPNIVVMESGK